jgi:hypothetical protein
MKNSKNLPTSNVISIIAIIISCAAILITLFTTNMTKEQYVNDKGRIAELRRDPTITTVGNFDGCEVKYFNRGTKDNSFYSTKCENTITTTDAKGMPTVFNAEVEPEDEMNHRDERKKMSNRIMSSMKTL